MKKPVFIILFLSISLYSQTTGPYMLNPVRNIFMQGNNINTVFRTDGVFNYDKVTYSGGVGGLIWPASANTRHSIDFASGLWIAAKVGQQGELRTAAAYYASFYSPGNIPVIGQVPPQSVCNDSSWRGYLVNLTDQTLVNGGERTKLAGGHSYTITYDSWANWPISKGAPYVEINGVPGYQPGWNTDRPGTGNSNARPDEVCYMVYMDYTDCTNLPHNSGLSLPGGTLPLGVEIHQLAFMFNCNPLQDMYFSKWIIINKSSLSWDSTYIALTNDVDNGDPQDDDSGCDTTRNLGFIYNGDNFDNDYGSNPPGIGTRLLQSALKFTGNNNDTARLPYDTLIGYKAVGMTAFIRFQNVNDPCLGDPDNAISGYNFMKGLDGCANPFINRVTGQYTKFNYSGDACNRIGWFDSLPSNRSYLQSSGPFTMNSGDTQTVVMAFVIGRGSTNFQSVCEVQRLSDSAYKYYYNDFPVCFPIGIQPISSEVPQHYALYQNYPNPFNPATKIKFDVTTPLPPFAKGGNERSSGGFVRLVIYDALGREIAVLINENLAPGTYETDFDGSNLPSGVYFYRLEVNTPRPDESGHPSQEGIYTITKKMVLLK